MEFSLNDLDTNNILKPIKILHPILTIDVSKDDAFNLIRKKDNLLTIEWFSLNLEIYIIGMILDCRLTEHSNLISERCNHFGMNFDPKFKYILFLNNGLMNTEIHTAAYNKDLLEIIKLRTIKIRKIIEI